VADLKHRDLHEGQVLIAPCAITSDKDLREPRSTGVEVTIIDFGLSRLEQSNGNIISSAMPSEVFEGQGAQWDVYRALGEVVGSDWAAYKPVTNVMVFSVSSL
jgi:serine/threonine-protein kinase haspin